MSSKTRPLPLIRGTPPFGVSRVCESFRLDEGVTRWPLSLDSTIPPLVVSGDCHQYSKRVSLSLVPKIRNGKRQTTFRSVDRRRGSRGRGYPDVSTENVSTVRKVRGVGPGPVPSSTGGFQYNNLGKPSEKDGHRW